MRQPSAASPRPCASVVEFKRAGEHGSDIRNGVAHQIKGGDVVRHCGRARGPLVHQESTITSAYLMVRIDPDKVHAPLKGEAAARDYLSKPARK